MKLPCGGGQTLSLWKTLVPSEPKPEAQGETEDFLEAGLVGGMLKSQRCPRRLAEMLCAQHSFAKGPKAGSFQLECAHKPRRISVHMQILTRRCVWDGAQDIAFLTGPWDVILLVSEPSLNSKTVERSWAGVSVAQQRDLGRVA